MLCRLLKTDNHVVLSLPNEMLESLNVKDGEEVTLELDRQQRRIIITPNPKDPTLPGVDDTFARQVNEFIEQYRPALIALAK